jgi:hypothetical protein
MNDVWIEYKSRAVVCVDHRPALREQAEAGARAIRGSDGSSWIRIPESDEHTCDECILDYTDWEW